jgi:hypothetical protein
LQTNRRYFVNLPIDQLLMGRATNLNKLKLFTPGTAAAFLHLRTQSAPPAEMVSTQSSLVKIDEDFSSLFLDETKEQTETSNTAVAFSPDATCDSDFNRYIMKSERALFAKMNILGSCAVAAVLNQETRRFRLQHAE